MNRIKLRADVPDGFDEVYLFGSLEVFVAGNPSHAILQYLLMPAFSSRFSRGLPLLGYLRLARSLDKDIHLLSDKQSQVLSLDAVDDLQHAGVKRPPSAPTSLGT